MDVQRPESLICIRPAGLEDAEAFADLSGQLGHPLSPEVAKLRIASILESDDHALFVSCAEDGVVIGWIHVFEALRVGAERFAEVGGLVVAAAHRRAGTGKRLCSAAETWSSARGVSKLRVRTRIGRAESIPFYEGVGFTGSKQQHILDKRIDRGSGSS